MSRKRLAGAVMGGTDLVFSNLGGRAHSYKKSPFPFQGDVPVGSATVSSGPAAIGLKGRTTGSGGRMMLHTEPV